MISKHCSYRAAISHQSVAVGCLVTEAVDDWACQAAETVPSSYEATIWRDVHEARARPHCPLQTNQEGAGSLVSGSGPNHGSGPNQLIAVCERVSERASERASETTLHTTSKVGRLFVWLGPNQQTKKQSEAGSDSMPSELKEGIVIRHLMDVLNFKGIGSVRLSVDHRF